MAGRRFEVREGSSSKFWEVEVDGSTVITRWGRIGAAGQSKRADHPSPAAARKQVDTLVAEKVRKGYAEIGAESTPDRTVAELDPTLPGPELARALAPLAATADADELVALLTAHEAAHGATEAHLVASEKVRPRLRLAHPYAHDEGIASAASSPSGRWLATGGPCGEDYDLGGFVSVWDFRAGRCVNVLGRVPGGVGGAENAVVALAWHASEEALAASTGAHGVARLAPFAADGGLRSSLAEAALHTTWDGIGPAWCWVPGGDDLVIDQYVVTLGEGGAELRQEITDDRCDFRHRVCGYDGVVTDGHFAIAADTLRPTPAPPYRDPRMGYAVDALAVTEDGEVSFTTAGRQIRLAEVARPTRYDDRFVCVAGSPDGQRVVVLTPDGRLARFDRDGRKVGELPAPWADGLAAGVDGVVALLAQHRLAFVTEDGRVLGDYLVNAEVDPHPLGAGVAAYRFDPVFPVGDGSAVGLPTGEIAVSPELRPLLDGIVAYALDGRRAWPLAWARLPIVDDLAELLPAAKNKPAKAPKKGAFAPVPATAADVVDEVARRLGAEEPHEAQRVAEAYAVVGRAEPVLARLIPALAEGAAVVRTAANAAVYLARAGEGAAVASLADAAAAAPLSVEDRVPMLVQFARAHALLGDRTAAEALLGQARLGVLASRDQDYAAGAAELLLAWGRADEARAVIASVQGWGTRELFARVAASGDRELTAFVASTFREVSYDHRDAAVAALAAGQLAVFDDLFAALRSSPYLAPPMKADLEVRRALAASVQVAREVATAPGADDVAFTRLAEAMRAPELARELADEIVARARTVPFGESYALWRAVGLAAAAGGDVSELVQRPANLRARLVAVWMVAEAAPAVARALATRVDPASATSDDVNHLSAAAGALTRAGPTELGAAWFEAARGAAGSDYLALGTVAREQLGAGDPAGAWASVQKATKARRPNAISAFLSDAGQRGRIDVIAGALAAAPDLPRFVLLDAAWHAAQVRFVA